MCQNKLCELLEFYVYCLTHNHTSGNALVNQTPSKLRSCKLLTRKAVYVYKFLYKIKFYIWYIYAIKEKNL